MSEIKGSGCKNCPAPPCETMNYRGSKCSAQRAKFGLGDPMTNADRIRVMSDKDMAAFLVRHDFAKHQAQMANAHVELTATALSVLAETLHKDWLAWLQQPAKEET